MHHKSSFKVNPYIFFVLSVSASWNERYFERLFAFLSNRAHLRTDHYVSLMLDFKADFIETLIADYHLLTDLLSIGAVFEKKLF